MYTRLHLMITLSSAFLIGLMGSLHCMGMCGPVCMALPLGQVWRDRLWALVAYNAGRIGVYMLLGVFFGLVGAGLRLAGLQAGLSVIAGSTMIAAGLFSIDLESKVVRWRPLQLLTRWVHTQLGTLLRRAEGSWWKMGLLNGLLPCGLVYLAVAGSLSLGNLGWSGAYMLFFGLGTLPAMMAVGMAGQWLGQGLRQKIRRLYPPLMVLLGLWLVYRGVNFHLPANFQFLQMMDGAPMCH